MLGNNLKKRFKLVGPSKLLSAKSPEGTSIVCVFSKKEIGMQNFSLHVRYVLFLNVGLYAGIHAEQDR